jgi:transposase
MPKPCPLELRERVVNAVESGASRREAADWFDVSPSSAIKWVQRRQATGSIAPKPSGGSISPLEAHAAFLFALIARQPDLTLDEIVAAMHKRRIAGSRSDYQQVAIALINVWLDSNAVARSAHVCPGEADVGATPADAGRGPVLLCTRLKWGQLNSLPRICPCCRGGG